MDFFSAIFLGLIQGLTEFLPISSSGHLIIFRDFIDLQASNGLAVDAVFQLATTLAILVYFRKEVIKIVRGFLNLIHLGPINQADRKNAIIILWASIPAIFLGLILEGVMDTVFRNANLVAVSLVAGGLIMLGAEKLLESKNNTKEIKDLNSRSGISIGLFQALALIPGMSRSGMTISGGLFNGLNRAEAARFSFIMAFPILLGSGLKKLLDLGFDGFLNNFGLELLVGFSVAFIVGMLAIHFLIAYLKKYSLKVFVWYRFALALIIILFL